MKKRILLVEDDENLGYIIQNELQQIGFEVKWFKDGKSAQNSFVNAKPDLCLLDVMLPETDGFTLASKFRLADQHTPIIFLTARDMLEDKLKGFKSGADDYITKPFSIEELTYRINVFLKRSGKQEDSKKRYIYKELEIDFETNQLKFKKEQIRLTEKEKELLRILIDNSNRIVKREEILMNIWGDDDYFKGRSLDVFISKIRKYLNKSSNKIENYHSIGFKWEEN